MRIPLSGPGQTFHPHSVKSCTCKEQEAAELRAKAAEYRVLARQSNDSEAAAEIFARAAELELQARDINQGK
jgi:hypothetical protein